jgi:hypothetical protein
MADIIILSDNMMEMELPRWTILSLLHKTSMVYRSITRWLELEIITNTYLCLLVSFNHLSQCANSAVILTSFREGPRTNGYVCWCHTWVHGRRDICDKQL